MALIPALSGAFGFFTMYTVSCFVRCYGRSGALLAAGALFVRLVFTLPCFLALAQAAWPLSMELFTLSFGRGKRSMPVLYGSHYFLLFFLCAVFLGGAGVHIGFMEGGENCGGLYQGVCWLSGDGA